jgi:hypothetical protein
MVNPRFESAWKGREFDPSRGSYSVLSAQMFGNTGEDTLDSNMEALHCNG